MEAKTEETFQTRPLSLWVNVLKSFSKENDDEDVMFAIQGGGYPKPVLIEIRAFLMTTLPDRKKTIAEIDTELGTV